MSAEMRTDRVLRDVLNSDNLRDLLGEDAVNNAMKWRFLRAALIVLDGHGLLGDPDAVKDATPAPLDPSKVRVGGTVTLENGETVVRGPVTNIEHDRAGVVVGFSIKGIGWRYLRDGVVAQQDEGVWTLTDHQPAPEPEPEWKPGMVAEVAPTRRPDLATRAVRGADDMWHNTYGGMWDDDEVSVRPLVVIDPAAVDVVGVAKAMHQVDYPGLDFALNLDQSVYVAKARAALAHLGIEATS